MSRRSTLLVRSALLVVVAGGGLLVRSWAAPPPPAPLAPVVDATDRHPAVAAIERTAAAPTGRSRLERHLGLEPGAAPTAVLRTRWDDPADRVDVVLDVAGAVALVDPAGGPGGATRLQGRRIGERVWLRDTSASTWIEVEPGARPDGDDEAGAVLALAASAAGWADPVGDALDDGTPVRRWSSPLDGAALATTVLTTLDPARGATARGRVDVWVDDDGWARRIDVVLDPTSVPWTDEGPPSLDDLSRLAALDLRVASWWDDLGRPQPIEPPPVAAPAPG